MSFLNKLFGVGNKETSNDGITDDGITELMRLAYVGNGDSLVGYLLAPGANHNVNAKDKNGWTALMMAAVKGNVDCVKNLIAAGAEVNAKNKDGCTALMMAAAPHVKKNYLGEDEVHDVAAILRAAGARE